MQSSKNDVMAHEKSLSSILKLIYFEMADDMFSEHIFYLYSIYIHVCYITLLLPNTHEIMYIVLLYTHVTCVVWKVRNIIYFRLK